MHKKISMKVPAYVSSGYLDKLISTSVQSDPGWIFNQKADEWMRLMAKSFRVKTDATPDAILALSPNPYIMHLIKSNRIIPVADEIDSIKSKPEAYFSNTKHLAVYLLEFLPKDYEIKYGYHFFGVNDKASRLTSDYFKMFRSGNQYKWESIKKIFSPHHSMIIADPYIFSKKNFESFKSLLFNILPKGLETSYHLTILAHDQDMRETLPRLNEIRNLIKGLERELASVLQKPIVEFHIFNDTEHFHDRFAVTNNIHISSGRGFGFFKDVKKGAEAAYSTYWSGQRPCTLMDTDNERGADFYEVYLGNLRMMRGWIHQSKNPKTSNPLFDLVVDRK